MTEAQANEVIAAAFVAGWPAASGNVPFVIDNFAITLPASGFFAALTVTMTTSEQRTSGGPNTRLVERTGWITVKLWAPAGAGTAGTDALIAAVRALFEMQNLALVGDSETIDTKTTTKTPIGIDGLWYMTLARTPFSFYETL